jgi:DNA-binding transcriptional LysR family regulator
MIRTTLISKANRYADAVELRQAQHLVAVADEQSFTRAAQRLGYVQSAVSISIQSLERELGIRLFDRTTRRVATTDAADALLPAAREMLAAADRVYDIAAEVRGVLRGTLRIGIMQAFAFADVPRLLGDFHREHPNVEIEIRPAIGGSAAMLEDLRSGALDIAFIAVVDLPRQVNVEPLAEEELVLVCHPGSGLAGQTTIALQRLAEASFVDFPPGWAVRTVVDRAFAQSGLARRVTIEVGDVATCLQLLRQGLGVAMLPPSLLPTEDRDLCSRPVRPSMSWHVVMASPADRPAPSAAARFAELVRAAQPSG